MSETEQNSALPAPCTFILVRHGETASNVRNTFRGRTDVWMVAAVVLIVPKLRMG